MKAITVLSIFVLVYSMISLVASIAVITNEYEQEATAASVLAVVNAFISAIIFVAMFIGSTTNWST